MKFIAPLIVVKDIGRSRRFYGELLGQRVRFDFGENVTFEGDFAIHLESHYAELIGGGRPIVSRSHGFELYFECEALAELETRLRDAGVEFLHETREQPWGQRVMRFYDPDGHIVEAGESLESTARRLFKSGMEPGEISKKISMPLEFVRAAIGEGP